MGQKGAKLTLEATKVAEHLVNNLSPVGSVSSKKMFGGHGIFESGSMFGLVTSQGKIYFKADDSNRKQYADAGSQQHGRMPYFEVPQAVLGNIESLIGWAQASIMINRDQKG